MIVAGSANPLLLGQSTGYNLTRSLRFRKSASAYLNRTPATNGTRTTWTFSTWFKRGQLGAGALFHAQDAGNTVSSEFNFASDDTLYFREYGGSGYTGYLQTTQVFRDPSAWYHLVLVWDSNNGTSGDRIRLYVNGTRVTAFSTATYPSSGTTTVWDSNGLNRIGFPSTSTVDGYYAETLFIDGQALTASSFGANNAQTGVWQPKKYAGTYGTNGFYLPFTDNSALTSGSNAGLGKDFSGNGNYWNTNNISITSGSTYDSMTDVPTLTSATAANFPTLNPLANSSTTLSNGNLSVSGGNDTPCTMVCPTSGHWYVEFSKSNASAAAHIGIFDATSTPTTINKSILYADTGGVYVNNSLVTTWASYASGDIISMGVDIDSGNLYFSKNNTYQGSVGISSSGISTSNVIMGVRCNAGVTANINFGQRPFTYPPTSPIKALNTFNLPTPTIGATATTQANKYFDATTYTGNGSSGLQVTNAGGFQPDFVWVKVRNASDYHNLADSVRGVYKRIFSNDTQAENTNTETLQSFNSNGFTVGNNGNWNTSGAPLVAWQWKGGGTAVTNTSGSITSSVSANTSAGFSVVTYTGTGANATVGHGLGVAPQWVVVKNRQTAGTSWKVYHIGLTSAAYAMELETTGAQASTPACWNSTAPTSSVVNLGSNAGVNESGKTHVMYCFAPIAGYSKFGSYTGNGSTDGPFVYTGFRPKYVLMKRIDSTSNWTIADSSRSPYNLAQAGLEPNTADAETTGTLQIDLISNGFKVRTSGNVQNTSGGTYIYMAFAETPTKFSLAR